MKKIVFLLLAAFLAFSCVQDEPVVEKLDKELSQAIAGSWLQVEYGFSPGSGYYTVPVPPFPPKIITFHDDLTLSSTNMELDEYAYFRIFTESGQQVIAFFEDDPGNKPLDIADLSFSYKMVWEGNHLTLYGRCFEGCHMKFKRISKAD